MKRNPLLTFAFSAALFAVSNGTHAQTMVSTTPKNRNFLIEKGTGVACGSCPTIDDTCQNTVNAYPGRGILIEYHVGPDARPQTGLADYTNPQADSLYNTIPFTYNMMVNRHDQGLPYNYTYVYNQVQGGAASMVSKASEVNLAINSNFNATTRQLVVTVEAYYTANSKTPKNFLNVALTEDSLLSKQYNVSTWVNNYNHMHVFRGYLTGQWGDTVAVTAQGTLVKRIYYYTLPTAYKEKNCHLVAFMTEEKHTVAPQAKTGEIITAIQAAIGATNTGMNETETAMHDISLFPNPSRAEVSVQLGEAESGVMSVYNMSGMLMYTSHMNGSDRFNISAWPAGIYMVQIVTPQGTRVQKLVKPE